MPTKPLSVGRQESMCVLSTLRCLSLAIVWYTHVCLASCSGRRREGEGEQSVYDASSYLRDHMVVWWLSHNI